MSFPRYPEYKDSGVEWLGALPSHWKTCRTKNLFSLMKREPLDDDEIVTAFRDGEVTLRTNRRIEGFTNAIHEHGYQRILRGDLVIHAMDAFAGAIGVSDSDGKSTPVYSVCTPKGPAVDTQYFGRLMRYMAVSGYINALSKGIRERSTEFRWSEASNVTLALPPVSEQINIVLFLDRETAKIDALVAEQRRLMELLKEKRQAVISHAVTKGLSINAPIKPSGVEWLGDVPEGWEIRKISQLFRAGKGKNGQILTKEFCGANEGIYPVYSGQTENDGIMGTWSQFEFDFGSTGVLFSTTVGAKAMNLRQLYGRFSLSQNCMIIWPTSDLCITRFFYYHFQPLFQWQRSMIPDHMQPSFRMEDLYSYEIALPPQNEQEAIVTFLDRELANFDTLTSETQRAIDLLQERRTALIAATVTGQIDVRQLTEEQPA